jgi:hypothetical protein
LPRLKAGLEGFIDKNGSKRLGSEEAALLRRGFKFAEAKYLQVQDNLKNVHLWELHLY